jgi:hypothetical protein
VLKPAVLYTALFLAANSALGDPAAVAQGDMRKLVFHETPKAVPEATLGSVDGDD